MNFRIDLSSPEHHERSGMPKALRDMYYGNDTIRTLIKSAGSPHNGGQHTLTIWGERREVIAWLDLFNEEYNNVQQEIAIIKNEIRKAFVRQPDALGLQVIVLREIKRQLPYNGTLESRPWFWSPSWEEDNE